MVCREKRRLCSRGGVVLAESVALPERRLTRLAAVPLLGSSFNDHRVKVADSACCSGFDGWTASGVVLAELDVVGCRSGSGGIDAVELDPFAGVVASGVDAGLGVFTSGFLTDIGAVCGVADAEDAEGGRAPGGEGDEEFGAEDDSEVGRACCGAVGVFKAGCLKDGAGDDDLEAGNVDEDSAISAGVGEVSVNGDGVEEGDSTSDCGGSSCTDVEGDGVDDAGEDLHWIGVHVSGAGVVEGAVSSDAEPALSDVDLVLSDSIVTERNVLTTGRSSSSHAFAKTIS